MAIKIIKPGRKPEPIHFECKHCGCVFEVDAGTIDLYTTATTPLSLQ